MKLTDVLIEQYGVWNDLLLPVHKKGITAIHGPNEAGKSTLMRFIRGVLYGFPAGGLISDEGQDHRIGWGGSLRVRHRGEAYELTRHIEHNGRQQFRATSGQRTLNNEEYQQLRQHVDADVYRTIYTLGLKELRELSTLQTDQVDDYLYGTSLGLIGQRLIQAEQKNREQSRLLADPTQRSGRLFDLSGKYDSVKQALAKSDRLFDEYEELQREIREIESTQRERKQRLEQLKRERTNYQYLYRIWTPWKRKQELQRELKQFSSLLDFPVDGVKRLDSLEQRSRQAAKKRDQLHAELKATEDEMNQNKSRYQFRDHASGVRALIDLKDLVETTERHLANVTADSKMLKVELDEKLQTIGAEWNLNRLAGVETCPESQLHLVTAAKNYQTALAKRARHRRTYRRISDRNHNRQVELQERLKRQNINSLDVAIRQANQRLVDLEKLAQLRVQETEYTQRIKSANTQMEKLREGAELPWWASLMLTLFALAGGFFVIAGLIRGITEGWLVGSIYLLTGVMGSGLVWALRNHYETSDYSQMTKLQDEIHECERKLAELNPQIARITGKSIHAPVNARKFSQFPAKNEADLIRQASQRIVELEGMARTQERILKTRKTLTVQRGRRPNYQRDVTQTRQAWCDLLKRLGLPETVRTTEAFQTWQHAVDAEQTRIKWEAAREDVSRHTELLAQFRELMNQLARRMQIKGLGELPLSQTLTNWQSLLSEFEESESAYQAKKNRARELKTQLHEAELDWEETESELRALLRQGSAQTAEEFRQNAKQMLRANEIEALMNDLDDQLNSLTREEPELAIVEEDLHAFNADQTQERKEMIALEIEDLEQELENSHEELGRLRQRINSLENDNTRADLQDQRARLFDRTSETLRDWKAHRSAADALADLTNNFQEKFQPETLAKASHYLRRLTLNRYERVRTPFGSRDLRIQESSGIERGVAELSDGTREQLFLAIRLALIDVFAAEGIEMPLVLDDICVNFDYERTEAAVETLMEFAQERQVLFFTCHQHLAQMLERHDVEPIWLPSLAQGARLAG